MQRVESRPAKAGRLVFGGSGTIFRPAMRPRYDRPAYLCAPVRTPIGKFGGALLESTAAELGTHAAKS